MKALFLLFFLVWIVFNERLTLEVALFGVVIAAFLDLFVRRYVGVEKAEKRRGFFPSLWLTAKYIPLLIIEIIKANFATLKFIVSGKEPKPVLVTFSSGLKTKLDRVVLANSITLTPGTITVSEHDDKFTVHCLDESMSHDLGGSSFVKALEDSK